MSVDHKPAATTTVLHSTVPLVVATPRTWPSRTTISETAVSTLIRAPRALAALAYATATLVGSTRPSVKWNTRWVRVVETELVPKTHIQGQLFVSIASERTEPIAGRIIEMPADNVQAEELRNPHSGFVAYAPVGSIQKGQDLVTTGGMRVVGNEIIQGKSTPCITCHGLDLMGVADVPPIAGRSPSYLVRQIWDIQQGTRNGAAVQLMKMAIAKLNEEDLVNIAAYVSSRPPRALRVESRLTN